MGENHNIFSFNVCFFSYYVCAISYSLADLIDVLAKHP